MITIPEIEKELCRMREENEKLHKSLASTQRDLTELRQQIGVEPPPQAVETYERR